MTYVEPTTNIQFFSGMNLSPNYENTLYFNTEDIKNTYFNNLTKVATVQNCTYQREHRGYIRVQVPISRLYNADYMRFQNPLFENKWFYAFVLSVNYINNITTEVQYQLDPMITWMGTFELGQCFIDRQHATDDTIGSNLVDEGLPTGEYVVESNHETFDPDISNWYVCVVYKPENYSDVSLSKVNGIYSGCKTSYFTTVEGLQNFLQNLLDNNLIDNVVSMFMCPRDFIISAHGGEFAKMIGIYLYPPYSKVREYTPKNNKLFTYPYKYMLVDNMEGNQKIYRYEFMNLYKLGTSDTSEYVNEYDVYLTIGSSIESYLICSGYKNDGLVGGEAYGKDLSGLESPSSIPNIEGTLNVITKTHFPMCSFSYDTYKAWLAQKNAYFTLDFSRKVGGETISALGNAVGNIAKDTVNHGGTLNINGVASGAIDVAQTTLTSIATSVYDNFVINHITPTTPNQSVGTPSTDVFSSAKKNTFVMHGMCVTEEYAKMIDDYFTMFGYAQKKVGVPNMNARPLWTYVKTVGCQVKGNIPADDARNIENIFDNGIRFWKNHTNIGDYSLDNSV